MKLIASLVYTERIIPFINKQVIKVLTGQRRVGKSYVLLQLMEHIRRADAKANIVYINMELVEFVSIKTDAALNAYLKDKFAKDKHNYFFIDEVQEVTGFERSLRSLLAKMSVIFIVPAAMPICFPVNWPRIFPAGILPFISTA